jgi:UMF1 family MFS transporter
MTNKILNRSVFAWLLYEGGSSAYVTIIISFVFAPYFAQKIALNPLMGATHWGYAIAMAGLIVSIVGPIIAVIADLEGRLKPWLFCFTLLTVFASTLLWFARPSHSYAAWTLFWVIIGTIGIEIAGIFYNTMLGHLVQRAYLGRISAWARSIGYLGSMGCLLIVLFCIMQPETSFLPPQMTADTRARLCGPFIALWFGTFALPLLLFVTDKPTTGVGLKSALRHSLFTLYKTLVSLIKEHRSVFWLLSANILFLDGLNTLAVMGTIYLSTIFHLTVAEILRFGIVLSLASATGTFCLGWLDDYFGAKPLLFVILIILSLTTGIMFFTESFLLFKIMAVTGSLVVGALYSVSRSLLVRISPAQHLAEIFSFYAISGRVTAFIGPVLASTMIFIFADQRRGMLIIPIFFLLSALLLCFVKKNTESLL